jgi:hypothetical protein
MREGGWPRRRAAADFERPRVPAARSGDVVGSSSHQVRERASRRWISLSQQMTSGSPLGWTAFGRDCWLDLKLGMVSVLSACRAIERDRRRPAAGSCSETYRRMHLPVRHPQPVPSLHGRTRRTVADRSFRLNTAGSRRRGHRSTGDELRFITWVRAGVRPTKQQSRLGPHFSKLNKRLRSIVAAALELGL